MSDIVDMPAKRLEAQGVNAVLVQIVDGRRVVSIACKDKSKMRELEAEARHLIQHYADVTLYGSGSGYQ